MKFTLLKAADDDAAAYADLQRTWKEDTMSPEEKAEIEARALSIPTKLMEVCHAHIISIKEFLPHCNTNITSDAKVGIHQLAGAARAAYQVRYFYIVFECMLCYCYDQKKRRCGCKSC